MNPFFKFASALLASTLAVAPAMAHPHPSLLLRVPPPPPMSCYPLVANPHRTILVRFPGRQPCLTAVRPGQDDRAAAFQSVYGGSPMTTADANQMQTTHRITAEWVHGGGGTDEVHFKPW